jgi:hypothetical protein
LYLYHGLGHHTCNINHLKNGNHERLHSGKSAKYGTFNVERMHIDKSCKSKSYVERAHAEKKVVAEKVIAEE